MEHWLLEQCITLFRFTEADIKTALIPVVSKEQVDPILSITDVSLDSFRCSDSSCYFDKIFTRDHFLDLVTSASIRRLEPESWPRGGSTQ